MSQSFTQVAGDSGITLGEINRRLESLVALFEKQNGRVDRLEVQVAVLKAWLTGLLAASASVGGIIGALVAKFLGG